MSIFTTYIYINGLKFSGKRIYAISWEEADFRAKSEGLELVGRLVLEVPCNEDYLPDWEKAIDYELLKIN